MLEGYHDLKLIRSKNHIHLEGSEDEMRKLYKDLLTEETQGNFLNHNKLSSMFKGFDLLKVKDIMENILKEAEGLSKQGVKEIILVAQDTTLYGSDIYGEKKLHILLKELAKIQGIEWIRVLYCYPEEIYEELVDEIASNKKV